MRAWRSPGTLGGVELDGLYMVGCYMWPHRVLDLDGKDEDPADLERVRWVFNAPEMPVHVTADGGMFVEVPDRFPRPEGARHRVSVEPDDPQLEFAHAACDAINLVVFELSLANVVGEPAAPFHLVPAELQDGCIRPLLLGHGAHQSDVRGRPARARAGTHEPGPESWRFRVSHEAATIPPLDGFLNLPNSLKLATVHSMAPALGAGSYYHWFQQRFGEALLASWMVVEQYIDLLWSRRVAGMKGPRIGRLRDQRTYSATVRTEVLQTEGSIDADVAETIHDARSRRNRMVHRGSPTRYEDARSGIDALECVLDAVCGPGGARPQQLLLSIMW